MVPTNHVESFCLDDLTAKESSAEFDRDQEQYQAVVKRIEMPKGQGPRSFVVAK